MIDPSDASAYEYSEHLNIRLLDGYLRYYFNCTNPEALSDEEWAEQIQTLHFIRKSEKETTE